MFYITQLAVKLWKFDRGERNEIEKVYMTLYWGKFLESQTRI